MFRELEKIEKLRNTISEISNTDETIRGLIHTSVLETIHYKGELYPIYSFVIGSSDKTAPTLGLFGGVHGLERVGSQVVIGYLKSLVAQMRWDRALCESLKHYRIVSIPIINPVGMKHLKRSNGNGVDLMRNAPVEAELGPKYKLYRGHRISPKLPWYRGAINSPMQTEAQILINFVKEEMYSSQFSLCIDFHSGFGLRDRLWFPYAKSVEVFQKKKEVDSIADLFKKTHPHHIYKIEQQSDSYTTHGDLWDYMFDQAPNLFIPWTLEMGSWIWLKKNPMQLFNKLGFFNPIVGHRYQRTMRRHHVLIDFFSRLIQNVDAWRVK
ncbi:MAG: DUF2817 domain-containing protein [Bacteriovorax sp.]|nr:DUF2817 domain-containing protein [Bacteriovorax sp.]